jgi:outer membrane PBP1 activator LpoA protein
VGDIRTALDGVTGRITIGHDQQFTRVLTVVQFRAGRLFVAGEKP